MTYFRPFPARIMPAQPGLGAHKHQVVILASGLFWEKATKLFFHPD